jgi:hypothetical protein
MPGGRLAAGFAALVVSLGGFVYLTAARDDAPSADRGAAAIADYGKLPLSFQPNRGQSDGRVRFLATGPGLGLFLTRDGATVSFGGADVSMRFLGAGDSSIAGVDRLPGTVNYLNAGDSPGSDEIGIPTFEGVRYQDVWPGIDARFYGNQQHLEYDFDVASGASVGAIKLRFAGQRHLAIGRDGALLLDLGGRTLRQPPPRTTQLVAGRPHLVPSRYVLRGEGRVGLAVGAYDHARPLRIDPKLLYSTYLAQGIESPVYAIAVDSRGSAYITGQTTSPDFPRSPGSLPAKAARQAQVSAFVTKLSPDGRRLVYSTYLGGRGGSVGNGIAVDKAGDAFVGGFAYPDGVPTTPGVFQPAPVGISVNGFVAKLAPSGRRLVYSTYLSGTGEAGGQVDAIAVDGEGNAYVAGDTESDAFPTTPGAAQGPGAFPTGQFDLNTFVTKLNPTGSQLLYSTLLAGSGWDTPGGIAIDRAGNAYVAGETSSQNFPITPGALQPVSKADQEFDFKNAFVTKIDRSGQHFVYSTYLGGSLQDEAKAIAVDSSGRAYVTGDAGSDDFPTTPGASQRKPRGFDTAFVSILSPGGDKLLRSTLVGKETNGRGIALDRKGNVFVVGFRNARERHGKSYGYRGFLAQLNPSLSRLLAWRKLGGVPARASAVAVDRHGDVYATGGSGPGLETLNSLPRRPVPPHPDYPSAFVTKLRP